MKEKNGIEENSHLRRRYLNEDERKETLRGGMFKDRSNNSSNLYHFILWKERWERMGWYDLSTCLFFTLFSSYSCYVDRLHVRCSLEVLFTIIFISNIVYWLQRDTKRHGTGQKLRIDLSERRSDWDEWYKEWRKAHISYLQTNY